MRHMATGCEGEVLVWTRLVEGKFRRRLGIVVGGDLSGEAGSSRLPPCFVFVPVLLGFS